MQREQLEDEERIKRSRWVKASHKEVIRGLISRGGAEGRRRVIRGQRGQGDEVSGLTPQPQTGPSCSCHPRVQRPLPNLSYP